MAELKGSLNGIGLPAIVQLIGELHHSGELELGREGLGGTLGFDDGRLVSAQFEDETGLAALSRIVLDLADADFRFVESAVDGEHSLDLGGADLQRVIVRIASGDEVAPRKASASVAPQPGGGRTVCPRLGFADDPMRNYSRPTALHRCYASIAPSLVTLQEQRELCLSGQYPTCQRFRNASRSRRAAGPPPASSSPGFPSRPNVPNSPSAPAVQQRDRPPPVPAAPDPLPLRRARPLPGGAASPSGVPEPRRAGHVPAGVAARITAAAASLRPGTSSNRQGFGWFSEHGFAAWLADAGDRHGLPSRGVLLLAGGAVLGFAVLLIALLVAMRESDSGLDNQPAAAPGRQAFESAPAASPAPTTPPGAAPASVAAVRPSVAPAAPGAAPASVAAARPSVAPAAPQPSPQPTVTIATAGAQATPNLSAANTAAATGGRTLTDIRFASSTAADWVHNAPYAGWADGAYRLRATQAGRFVAVAAPINPAPDDVMVSATFRKTAGPPGGGYGLILRDQGPEPRDGVNQTLSAYVFETSDQGEFGVWRRDGDHWIDLVPWTRSAAVRLGGSPNELVVRATGDHLTFTVNGIEVANLNDATLPSGGLGIFAGGDFNEVALDHFAVQALN